MEDGRRTSNGSALHASVLVVNKLYMAVRITSVRRAFALLVKEDAEALARVNGHFAAYRFPDWIGYSRDAAAAPADHEEFVHTPRWRLLVPRVIRLVAYDQMPRRQIRFSRRNVMARDENRCQYCGHRFPAGQLSLDHVVPRSLGGATSWTNVVTACHACNTRKGGRRPRQAAMALIREPVAPRRNPVLADHIRHEKYAFWRMFLDGDGAMGPG